MQAAQEAYVCLRQRHLRHDLQRQAWQEGQAGNDEFSGECHLISRVYSAANIGI